MRRGSRQRVGADTQAVSSSPEVTACASCGLCGQDGSSARVLGVVGAQGSPVGSLPGSAGGMRAGRRLWGPCPAHSGGRVTLLALASSPPCPQAPFLDVTIKPTLPVP